MQILEYSVFDLHKSVPGIEPGPSVWEADVLSITPHGQNITFDYKYKSFPVGNVSKLTSNRQPADSSNSRIATAALPLRQRSMIGAEGDRKQSFGLYIGCASDSCLTFRRSSIDYMRGNSRDRTCGLPVNGRTLCHLSYEPIELPALCSGEFFYMTL